MSPEPIVASFLGCPNIFSTLDDTFVTSGSGVLRKRERRRLSCMEVDHGASSSDMTLGRQIVEMWEGFASSTEFAECDRLSFGSFSFEKL